MICKWIVSDIKWCLRSVSTQWEVHFHRNEWKSGPKPAVWFLGGKAAEVPASHRSTGFVTTVSRAFTESGGEKKESLNSKSRHKKYLRTLLEVQTKPQRKNGLMCSMLFDVAQDSQPPRANRCLLLSRPWRKAHAATVWLSYELGAFKGQAQFSQKMNLETLCDVDQVHRKESRGRLCLWYCNILGHLVLRKAKHMGKWNKLPYLPRTYTLYLCFKNASLMGCQSVGSFCKEHLCCLSPF